MPVEGQRVPDPFATHHLEADRVAERESLVLIPSEPFADRRHDVLAIRLDEVMHIAVVGVIEKPATDASVAPTEHERMHFGNDERRRDQAYAAPRRAGVRAPGEVVTGLAR